MIMLKIDSPSQFNAKVLETVRENGIGYMDAILMICEKEGMEVEVAAKLCDKYVKQELENEARDLNFLPRTSKLPI
jgi:hypothetical protein